MRGLVWVLIALLGLASPAMAQTAPQPVSLEAVAVAVDTRDLPALRAASADQALINQLRTTDPETLIGFQLALAQAYAEAGLTSEAVAAYEQALMSMMLFRGQGHISMAEPLEAVAALQTDPAKRAQWLKAAFDIRERVWGQTNPNLAVYRQTLNTARAQAGLEPIVPAGGVRAGDPNFDLVDVYYATHREATGRPEPSEAYGAQRGALNFGVAEVSVPRDRAPGTIPRPSIWTFEFRPDPDKHMILNSVTPITDRDSFFQRVSEVVDESERKEAFVFIHGYNTSFEGAAIRAAQLAVDMNLDGAAILYAWPSRASLLGYAADTRTVADEALLEDVAAFLTQVAKDTGATRVHLVAHSMGNRVLMRALDRIAARNTDGKPLFNEVVLAAADVGVDEFQATLPRILSTGERYTLYASGRDRALQISEQVNSMRRAGDARSVMIQPGLQTVDTTAASGGLLGHDDFAGSALADFRAVMWLSLAPERRCVLETAQTDGGRYWAFGGGDCPAQEFEEATELVRTTGAIDRALAKLDDDISKAAIAARASLIRKRERLQSIFGAAMPASPGAAR